MRKLPLHERKGRFNQSFAVFIVVLVFSYVLLISFTKKISDANTQFVNIAFGMFIAKFGTIVDYFFGAAKQGDIPTTGATTITDPVINIAKQQPAATGTAPCSVCGRTEDGKSGNIQCSCGKFKDAELVRKGL